MFFGHSGMILEQKSLKLSSQIEEIEKKTLKSDPWRFLETKIVFSSPRGAQMEPNGAKIEPKVSPKLLKNEAKIGFKNQLKFDVVFYWFSVIFDTI